MGLVYNPLRRFTDLDERIVDASLDLLAQGTAIVEPETIGIDELFDVDAISAVSAVSTAYTDTYVKVGTQSIASNLSATLSDLGITTPSDATVDSVVIVDQPYADIVLTGYIEMVTGVPGVFVPRCRFVAHNIGGFTESITAGDVIKYAIHDGFIQEQATSPNAAMTVTPGLRWLNTDGTSKGLAVNVANMNATANPVITIPDGSITDIELKGPDIAKLAAQYTGQRGVLTVSVTTSVPNGAAVLLGTVTIPGLIGTICQPGQRGSPYLTAKVTAPNTVSVYARNNSFATQSVAAGAMIKIFAY